MADSTSPAGPLEAVQAFIKAAAFDRDDEATKALLSKESLAQAGQMAPPPDAHEMTYEYGQVKEENGEWFVPVTIINPKDSNQPPMTMQFAPVLEDGKWKLDMNKMMERMLGGIGMDKLVEGMTDAMKGIGEAMADGLSKAFEGLGDAMSGMFDASQNDQLNKLPEDSSPEMAEVFTEFNEVALPDQLGLMREALGSELNLYVDWYTFQGDAAAAKKLTIKVLHNLRSAICLSSGNDKIRESLREKLREIVVFHTSSAGSKILHMERGRLQVTACLSETGGTHSSSEIQAALREGIDADKGPAIARLNDEIIPQLREEMRDKLELDIEINVDIPSFTQGFDTDTTVRNLKKLEDDVFRNFLYVLREVKERSPNIISLMALRFEHVPTADKRCIYVHGNTIVFQLCFTEDDGFYYTSDLEQILPALAAGVPDYSDKTARYGYNAENEPPAEHTAFAQIGEFRDYNMQELTGNIQQAVGRGLHFDVDWASLGEDADAAAALKKWGFNRICGAARFIGQDQAAQQDMTDMINGFRLYNVATPEEKRIDVNGGILDIHACFNKGEAGCFYEHEIARRILESMGTELKPKIADIREAAEYWEKQLLEEHEIPIKFYIDFAGFTSSFDDQQNKFALTLLKEHGVDALYYAVTGLFEKNPNFKQQFGQRVRRLNVLQVPEPSQKQVSSYDDAISYYCFLHEGYKGYLTIDELKKQLPAIVAAMADIPPSEESSGSSDDGGTDIVEETNELAELVELQASEQRLADADADGDGETDLSSDDGGDPPENTQFDEVRSSIGSMLPNFAQQFAAFLGKPIELAIDWDSLGGDPVAAGQLLNVCLSPLMTGMMTAGQDPAYRDDLVKYIDHVTLRRVTDADDQALRLEEGELVMAVMTDGEPTVIEGDQATAILKGMIDHIRAAKVEPTKTPRKKKAEIKPAPKKAKTQAKKEAPKAKGKPTEKPKAKPTPKKKKK